MSKVGIVKEINMGPSLTNGIFKLFDVIFMVSGTYMTVTKKTKSKLHLMYCLLVTFMALFQAGRVIGLFLQPASLEDYLATHVAFCAIQSVNLFLNLVHWIGFRRDYDSLKKEFLHYEINYGLTVIGKRRKCIKHLMGGCIISPIVFLISLGFTVYISPEMKIMLFPFNKFSGWKLYVGHFALMLTEIPILLQFLSISLLFFFCSYFLSKEFGRINSLIQSDIQQMTVLKLNTLMKQHQAVCDLLSAVNRICKHYLVGSILAFFTADCFMLVMLTNVSSLTTVYFTAMLFWAIVYFLVFNALLLIASQVSSMAHETLDEIWKIDFSSLTDKGLKLIDIFTTKLSGSTIGYDVYGLFTIQKSSILAICGTLLTYFIVAVQFKPGGNGENSLEIPQNLTFN
ncbi:uncharacterized protein LOC126825273 [Patella vulgata]|uniref:uncharacterized protein LOC126825273 n=1 Tax=Patella vulgata TaxID=6465 RepID=UPI00218089B4|nr:uncharacterized protein LOC126825273 [Patella vulgata]